MKNRVIKVDVLARVEGEGGLVVRLKDNKIRDLQFRIFEPPRFFEAFLRGRRATEVPDITARICGICPVAYAMSSIHAVENALEMQIPAPLRALRRLVYCGEWIESHVLHVYLLHAPDFLGYESAIHMAKDHGDAVQRGLRMKHIGNHLLEILGGREVHPINLRIGGFYRAPSKTQLRGLADDLKWAADAAEDTVRWTGTLTYPDLERDYEFVALRHPAEYPMNEGRIVSNRGLDIATPEFLNHIEEQHVERSTALQARIKARGEYFVGPLARVNLNFDRLTPRAQAAATAAGLTPGTRNPYRSITARSVEVLYAFEEALRLIQDYEEPEPAAVEMPMRAGTGHGCTEAPRGILYHRYTLDDAGLIRDARIIPPTSQNQKSIESDVRACVEANLALPDDRLQWRCEQTIRNYDPCISCSTHFLKLRVERE